MAIIEGYMEIIFSLTVFVCCYWWFNRRSVVINWPVVGMLPGFLLNAAKLHEKATSILNQTGLTFSIHGPLFGDLDYLLTADPHNVHHILTKNFANYEKGPELRKILEFVGGAIIATDGDDWKLRHKVMQWLIKDVTKDGFGFGKIIKSKVLNNLSPILEHYSSTGHVVDLQDVIQRLTFDTICKLSLGVDPNTLSLEFPDDPYAKAFGEMSRNVIKRHITPSPYWKLQQKLQIGDERRFTKAWKVFDGFLYDCISKKTHQLSNQVDGQTGGEPDLLGKLLMADEDLNKSKEFVRDITFSLLTAGKNTVASAITWLLYMVSINPDAEKNILDEIKANLDFNNNNVFFRAEEMKKLVYLHGAISETLRLYPPIPFERKIAIADDRLPSGHRVKKGTKVLFSFYSMGRAEQIWGKDCLEFKPERWITQQGKIRHVGASTFVAFNAGPRTCLGKEMTYLEMKMIASWLIWNYHFQLETGDKSVLFVNSLVLNMKHGFKVKLVKRHV